MKEFLTTLFGQHVNADRAIQLYKWPKDSKNWAADCKHYRFRDVESAVKWLGENSRDHNIYFNTSLMAETTKGRGMNKEARVVPAIFADLDADCGEHSGKRPSKEAIRAWLKSGELPMPSVVVDSGGGYHVYWVLDEALTEVDLATSLLTGFNDKIADWYRAGGFRYERLKDVARVLRVPGTMNYKYEKPVKIIHPQGDPLTYPVDRLLEFMPEDDGGEILHTLEGKEVNESTAYTQAIYKCLMLDREWNNDASSFVLRCCRQCVRAGCNSDQTVKVVQSLRHLFKFPGDWSPKAIKQRYADALEQNKLGEGLHYDNTEYGFTNHVCDLVDNRAYFVHEWKKWISWDGRRFQIDHERAMVDATVAAAKEIATEAPEDDGTKETRAIISAIMSRSRRYQSAQGFAAVLKIASLLKVIHLDELDRNPDLFHCENKTLILSRTDGSVRAIGHSPDHKNTQISQVPYIPEAKCPAWDNFIREIAIGEDGAFCPSIANYLQQIAGFCLTGRTDNQSLFIFHGDGRNGKGAFCRTLLRLLGSYGASVQSSILMDTGRNEHLTQFATLYGRRCVIAQESEHGCKLSEAQVKWLTGSDGIRCRRMREDEWEFQPTHKIIMATNNLPTIKGGDKGIWSRIKLIPFRANVKPDPNLEPKLLLELPGILNWALAGYADCVRNGGLAEPEEVAQAGEAYKADMDLVAQFVEDRCVLGPEYLTTNVAVFQAMKLYCEEIGVRPLSMRKITVDLQRMGVETWISNSVRYKRGIGLKAEIEARDIDF